MSLIQDNLAYYGVVHGCSFGQNERVDEINQRMYDRNLPTAVSNDISKIFSPKPSLYPVSTKYKVFPIHDDRKMPKKKYGKGPWYGDYVDNENDLFNRNYRYGADNNIENVMNEIGGRARQDTSYIPSINSSLYKVEVPLSTMDKQPFPLLFQQFTYTTTDNKFIYEDDAYVLNKTTKQNIKRIM